MEKLLRLSQILKGGPGSGNFGHSGGAGGPGNPGGSGGGVKRVGRISNKVLKEVEAWGGDRAKYAKAAVNAIQVYGGGITFRDSEGNLKGVASYDRGTGNKAELERIARLEGIKTEESYDTGYESPNDKATRSTKEFDTFFSDNIGRAEIGFMATAPGTKGIGRQMVGSVLKELSKRSYGSGTMVKVAADKKAVGFWKKIGFKPLGKMQTFNHPDFGRTSAQDMYMTFKDIQAAAGVTKAEEENDPEIFCWPTLSRSAIEKLGHLSDLLKGGPGSGNFGHAGRPGERGGSSSEGGSAAPKKVKWNGKSFNAKTVEKEITSAGETGRTQESRAADESYVRALQSFHGITLEADQDTDGVTQLAVHETLALQPAGVLQYMRDHGVKVTLAGSERPTEEFQVGDNRFAKGGHADYANGEILVVAPKGNTDYFATAEITAHEAGHFGVNGLLSSAAEARNLENRYETARENVRTRVSVYGSDSPQAEEARQIRDKYKAEFVEKGQDLLDSIKDFRDASEAEGGFTSYSKSYKGTPQGNRSDIMEYAGPDASLEPARYAVSRFQNENFAEITAKLHLQRTIPTLNQARHLKENFPKTYKAYRALNRILSKPFKYTKAKRV